MIEYYTWLTKTKQDVCPLQSKPNKLNLHVFIIQEKGLELITLIVVGLLISLAFEGLIEPLLDYIIACIIVYLIFSLIVYLIY